MIETGRAPVFVMFEGGRSINDSAIHSESLIPKVGIEPTRVLPHRILSPVLLPHTWYQKHVAVILKVFGSLAVTMLPSRIYSVMASG
jgi:hypothetical protein